MKKSILAIAGAVVLTAAVGVGATIAYFSAQTEAIQNTFTLGSVAIDLTEYTMDENESMVEMPEGIAYTDVMPGDMLSKQPVVTIADDSQDAYLGVKITGFDFDMLEDIYTADTVEIDGLAVTVDVTADGYEIIFTDAVSANDVITLFDYVTVENVGNDAQSAEFDFSIQAFAVQAANLADAPTALSEINF